MITIIARVKVDPDRLEDLMPEMQKLVATTRSEKGCIRYELHQDNTHLNQFVFVEAWRSRRHWRQHMRGSAVMAFNQSVAGAFIDFDLSELTEIAPQQT